MVVAPKAHLQSSAKGPTMVPRLLSVANPDRSYACSMRLLGGAAASPEAGNRSLALPQSPCKQTRVDSPRPMTCSRVIVGQLRRRTVDFRFRPEWVWWPVSSPEFWSSRYILHNKVRLSPSKLTLQDAVCGAMVMCGVRVVTSDGPTK